MIDQPRYAEWIQLSHRAGRLDPFITVAIQGLGRLDAMLVAQDCAYLARSEDERTSGDTSLELNDRITNSYLWVLGTYEIVRTIDQRYRENPQGIKDSTAELTRNTKHKFERVRVPLAKFEPARRFSDTDSAVAFPALDRDHGIAWCVAKDVFVTRRELSESFMNLLRAL